MKTDKTKKSLIAVCGIIGLIFILLFALIPFKKPASSWIMFVFSIISIGVGGLITYYAFGKGESLVSKFYGYPVFRIGYLYILIQISLSIVLFIIGAFLQVPYWIGLLLSLILLGAAAIGVITTDNARDFVEDIDVRTATVTRTVTLFNIDIADMVNMCTNEAIHEPLKKLAAKFKYSDPVSSPQTEEQEHAIQKELDVLRGMLSSDDTNDVLNQINKISNLLSARNRICEISK